VLSIETQSTGRISQARNRTGWTFDGVPLSFCYPAAHNRRLLRREIVGQQLDGAGLTVNPAGGER
jgi:hypothetical protein